MYPRPVPFNNERRLSLKHDNLDPNQILETNMKKVEALKNALSEGTYAVPAEDLAPKLMESMFQSIIFNDEARNTASGSQLETGDQVNPKQRADPKVPDGVTVSRKDLRSTSVPSKRSPVAHRSKREPR
jgi:Anti-sigma-28 factor, FlgM